MGRQWRRGCSRMHGAGLLGPGDGAEASTPLAWEASGGVVARHNYLITPK
jgi:hypothetical protein